MEAGVGGGRSSKGTEAPRAHQRALTDCSPRHTFDFSHLTTVDALHRTMDTLLEGRSSRGRIAMIAAALIAAGALGRSAAAQRATTPVPASQTLTPLKV